MSKYQTGHDIQNNLYWYLRKKQKFITEVVLYAKSLIRAVGRDELSCPAKVWVNYRGT